ncbi:MAG: antitoxin VapB family protein, partial [Archaeoglobaceae archaeon]
MHIHTNIIMAKTIALSDEVYEMLSKAKMKGESFSDAIR